ncbi:glycosyltransferase family 2 protein [Massilia sp. DJPM01]|uniref:glycosyltransferase family 2 protein n=1 Tax=Massilia sp. DJPM01 TaxID=3024404 RepID=UPI00259F1EEB|nr:glycosyltransferase family 2 protein [Massilia sp. DJPM01]MDM5178274.1 glycosyltransferase family 2 protein [Massilia sp. DJPM01]
MNATAAVQGTPPAAAWSASRLREDFLLAQAVDALQDGWPADALLAAEAACRRHAEAAIPALLRATILQASRSALSSAAWYHAWRRDPQDARLQDLLVQDWLAHGASARIAALAPALLPARCRAASHASLLPSLRQAACLPAGACWRAGSAIEGMLFEAHAAAPAQLCLRDELSQQNYDVRLPPGAPGAHFSFIPPHPDGVWSLALAGATAALPGSPLVFAVPRAASAAAAAPPATTALGVLIPVYSGLAQVQACIASVLASLPANRAGATVLVIDDASPEPALAAWLDTQCAAGRIGLLRNRYNLGFVESVNCGLRQLPGHDVLLLNADTLVHGDWLDRLRAALYRADDIAAVAPWSNNGEISSFPSIARAAPAPDAAGLARLDDQASALHRAGACADVDVPACCGFAMLMRASVLAAIGGLDGNAIERGYGEEVDWCLRAAAAGYRHRIATGVYVAHAGGVSFGDEKHLRVRQNRAVLMARYPHYYSVYQRFLQDDPLAAARACLAAALPPAAAAIEAPPAPLPPSLASSCTRIAVLGHCAAGALAAGVLALARLVAARTDLALRLLVIGEVSETLWRTGVVDVVAPASGASLLSDSDLIGLSGCIVLLAADPAQARIAIATERLDPGFDAGSWFSALLARAHVAPRAALAPLHFANPGSTGARS